MPSRLLPVSAGITLLTVASLAIPAGTASADPECRPAFDVASISAAPTTLVLTSKGSKSLELGADFTAPCADDDASDLSAFVIYYTPHVHDDFVLETTEGIERTDNADGYRFAAGDQVRAKNLSNADAGTWTTDWYVFDDEDQDTNDVIDGPNLTVLRAASLSAHAGPEPVAQGRNVTVTGKLTRANWTTGKDGAYAHKSVKLQYKTAAGTYATVKTVTSSSKGKLKATVKATGDGYYRFAFGGSSTTAAATSTGDYVDVK